MSTAPALVSLTARALPIALWLGAGALFGAGYFALLRSSVRSLATRRHGGALLAMAALRMGASGVLFACAAHWGAPTLLAAFGGFLLARSGHFRAVRG